VEKNICIGNDFWNFTALIDNSKKKCVVCNEAITGDCKHVCDIAEGKCPHCRESVNKYDLENHENNYKDFDNCHTFIHCDNCELPITIDKCYDWLLLYLNHIIQCCRTALEKETCENCSKAVNITVWNYHQKYCGSAEYDAAKKRQQNFEKKNLLLNLLEYNLARLTYLITRRCMIVLNVGLALLL
jgi:hypothetical protein